MAAVYLCSPSPGLAAYEMYTDPRDFFRLWFPLQPKGSFK